MYFRAPFVQRSALRLLVAVQLVLMVVGLTGCASIGAGGGADEKQLVIPDFPTAKEQYGFAVLFKDAMIPSTEPGKRASQISRMRQCYERVVSNFPDDATYTPLARLEIADGFRTIGDVKKARSQYEEILEQFPDNEYVAARAHFSIGRILDQTGQPAEAKAVYHQVHEDYANSSSGAVRDIVKRADRLYYSVRETSTKKKKSSASR